MFQEFLLDRGQGVAFARDDVQRHFQFRLQCAHLQGFFARAQCRERIHQRQSLAIDYQGAIFIGVSVASWLLPLLVLELYFRAERSHRAWRQVAMAGLLGVFALLTLAGSAAAAAFMWWPVL